MQRLGILAAMPQEVEKLKGAVEGQEEHKRGNAFVFTTGTLAGRPVVFAAANVGMVFAGSAATTMINEFGATKLIFTGVAGGLKADQKVGDIVVGRDVVNYEMDARAFQAPWDAGYVYQLGEVPFVKWRFYEADPTMLGLAMAAPVADGVVLRQGRIATGSIFVTVEAKLAMEESVWKPLGYPDAVEMENAGVAQICRAYDVPYLSLRALSDVLSGDANEDFGKFCQQAADNVFPIVLHLAKNLS
jgi:5'-methylthioadenosine/S-adenosylhomocysteine nucleosidase